MKTESPLTHISKAFVYAGAGIRVMYRTQISFRIQLAFTVAMIIAGLALRLPASDWCWLILAMALVWSAEALNTAVEFLADVVCPDLHPAIKQVKDVAAAAVLFTVIGAIAIGALVLGPPLWARLSGG